MINCNLIIIGGGPGGMDTALEAARRGLTVTLFEARRIGGTCLNEGCIPTKCLVRNAEALAQFKKSDKFGIDNFTFEFDFNKVMERKNEVVEALRAGATQSLEIAKVNIINERASFKDAKTVVTESGEEYTADNIIIATGSVSKSLPVPGADLECVMDSTDILDIDHVPESLTIIGGGVIGMEFASIFNSLGSRVTVIEFMKQILPPFDTDIAKRLKQSLSKQGIEIITSAAVTGISQNEDYEIVTTYDCKGKEGSVTSSDLLMAVGRRPNTSSLNLQAAGIATDERSGAIVVDRATMATSVPDVYAIGDANGGIMLAHTATFEGLRALNTIMGKKDSIDLDIVPSAVFTTPECGMVGLTEQQCKTSGIEFTTGTSFYRANGKALAMAESEGLCKLIFSKEDGRLLGAHVMGAQAADLAQQCADLMACGATRDRICDTVFSHPTISELILSAARNMK